MNTPSTTASTAKIEGPLRQHALTRPHAPAIEMPKETISFAELDRRVTATAHRLDEEIAPKIAALLLPNNLTHVVLLWALWRAGCVAAPLSTRSPDDEVSSLLQALDTQVLITTNRKAPPGARILEPADVLAAEDAPERPVFFDPEQPASAIFTSGSTGVPKAALHTIANHYFSALGSRTNIALEPGDRWLLSLPLYHVGGLAIMVRAFEAGATVVLPPSNGKATETISARPITHASLVPTQLRRLVDRLDAPPPSMKAVLLGGGPFPPSLTDAAYAAGWPIHTSYGLTEMDSQVTATPPDAPREALQTAGRLLPHRELRLTEEGIIQTRGRTLFAGYLRNGALHSATSDEGWFTTGDRGTWTDEGLLRITGRTDRMFVSGGENVQPEEIEAALHALEDVRRAVVVAVPDDEYGARPVAFVEGSPPPQALTDQLKQILPPFKTPDAIYEWPDDLPDGMKPDRRALAQRARQKREA